MRGLGAVVLATMLGVFAAAQTISTPDIRVETVVGSNLSQPTAMAFIAPGDILVCEKGSGQVKRFTNGAYQGVVLDLPVNSSSERGLLGMALDPSFATNGYVYLYWSAAATDGGTWQENRVARFTWNGSQLVNQQPALVAFPSDSGQGNGPNHDGGIILFGPDGKLYGVTGDLNRGRFSNPRVEQNTSNTAVANVGGIFRLDTDGSVPSDNPFVGDSRAEIRRLFAYGVRNSYGMCIDSVTGKLWMTENGPNVYDEINYVEAGFNSGWLKLMGPDARNATYSENGNTAYNESDLTVLAGSHYRDPEFSWLSPIGVTSIVFLNTDKFPAGIRNFCAVGENNNGQLYLFEPNGERNGFVLTGSVADKVADNSTERNLNRWGTGWSVVTDMEIGPDGYLYVVSLGLNRVLRVRPVWTDTVPDAMEVLMGTLISGALRDLEASDNSYVKIGSTYAPAILGRPVVTDTRVEATLSQGTIARLDLEVEMRANAAGTKADIQLYDVLEQRWVSVGAADVGMTDTLITLTSIPNGENYVDGATKKVLARIVNYSSSRFTLFQTSIDRVSFRPVYP